MIAWLIPGALGAVILYALVLRMLWRGKEKDALTRARKFIFDSSSSSIEAAERRAKESASTLEGLSIRPIGFTGEIVPSSGLFLCPLSSMVSSSRKAAALGWCGQSAEGTTLALIGENEIPPFLVSAFETNYVLITAVGNGESGSESTQVKQYSPTLAEAWGLHEATLIAWEAAGHAAVNDAKRVWTMAEEGLAEFFQPAPASAFERENYYQKCAFIIAGCAVSMGLGVTLALWL